MNVVEQKSKSVWKVSGSYKGKLVQREGRRPHDAIARWREYARNGAL